MPAVNRQASESVHAFMARVAKMDVLLCSCCRHGQLHVSSSLQAASDAPEAALRLAALRHCGLPVLAGAMAANDPSMGVAQNQHHQTQNSTGDISQAIICGCTRASNLQTPMPPTRAHQGRRISPTRFICRV